MWEEDRGYGGLAWSWCQCYNRLSPSVSFCSSLHPAPWSPPLTISVFSCTLAPSFPSSLQGGPWLTCPVCSVRAAATPANDHFCDYATGVRILVAGHKNDTGSREGGREERGQRGRDRGKERTEKAWDRDKRGRHMEKTRLGRW